MLSVLHPLAPLVAPEPKSTARDTKMAPKKNKSKVEDEEIFPRAGAKAKCLKQLYKN